jgi:predicted nucleotidyltransferase
MTPSFQEILRVLNRHEVEFIVVGGVAAVIHGAPTTTFDLDALIRVSETNAGKLSAALAELQARYREHPADIEPQKSDLLAGGHLLLMTRAGPLDVLGFIGDGLRYEDLISSVTEFTISSGRLQVIDLESLIAEKRRMGRPKDQAMLELLEAVLKQRRNAGFE